MQPAGLAAFFPLPFQGPLLTAVEAEATGDGFATVGYLDDLFRCPLRDFEIGAGHDEIVGIVAARDLSAVRAMAERLCINTYPVSQSARVKRQRFDLGEGERGGGVS
jgi:hypothetical protein